MNRDTLINMRKISLIIFGILAAAGSQLWCQEGKLNLNDYYAFPLSAGVCFTQFSGLGNRELSRFTMDRITGEIRFPLPRRPVIQPLITGGLLTNGFTGDLDTYHQDWSHYHVFGGPGIAYGTRISREFEVGAEFFGALTQSYFNELVFDGVKEPRGQLNVMASLAGRLALNPSYSFSISVHPTLAYLQSLGNLKDYDGFSFGVGFSASYRFGEDPDSAGSSIKAIRFEKLDLPPLFAAMQSYYVKNPAGSVVLTNTEKYAIDDLNVSFMQPGYMDSPSPVVHGVVLKPGESVEIPLTMTFNNEVFRNQGVTPLTGEIIVGYTVRSRAVEQRKSVSYDMYDRNALTWDDDRKAAAFVTFQDSAVRNYASHIRQIHRDLTRSYLSSPLQFAMQAYNALGELGLLYQIDPSAPFTLVQGDAVAVDSVSLPRETLKRLTGDCDDMTVLFCAILQSIGIETALVTVPGHIYCAFDTGVPSADFALVNPDRALTIQSEGTVWVPVEITMIGKKNFAEAWSRGAAEYAQWNDRPENRGFFKIAQAQELFRPVALKETDLGLQYGSAERVTAAFERDMAAFSATVLTPVRKQAETRDTPQAWNSYAIAAAKLGDYAAAEEALSRALRHKPDYVSAQMNLGSIHFLNSKYSQSLSVFQGIEENLADLGFNDRALFKLYLNLSKTCHALEKTELAADYYAKASEADPERAVSYHYLTAGGADRASDATGEDPILFFDE